MSDTPSLGSIATSVDTNFSSLAKLITSSSYVAGLGFSVASIMKFKQHKDNPTQVPIGTPDALLAVAAALLYLPEIEAKTGFTPAEIEAPAATAGITTETVGAAAAQSGITPASVEAAASQAGVPASEIAAAEGELEEKTAG